MMSRTHTAWDAALFIIRALRDRGHVALLAGGCVRDRLLGLEPKDYDVATDAPPHQILAVFPRAKHVGAKFGVMLVRKFRHECEVATFRTDGTYSDGRHPDDIAFGTERQDAGRRDFTINGMFHDPLEDRVIDHVGGQADLTAGIIRTIGDPVERFAEDHLRMLRAIRFAARLGFDIDPGTKAAIIGLAPRLAQISAERVWMELQLMLCDRRRAVAWALLLETGLRDHLSPAWTPGLVDDEQVGRRLAALPASPVHPALALAAALCDYAASTVAAIGRSLKLSNDLVKAIEWHAETLPSVRCPSSFDLAALKTIMANGQWSNLLDLLGADLIARSADSEPLASLRRRAAGVLPADVAPKPLVSGDDLCAAGVQPGRAMGRILRAIYRAQLNEEIITREDAWRMVRRMETNGP